MLEITLALYCLGAILMLPTVLLDWGSYEEDTFVNRRMPVIAKFLLIIGSWLSIGIYIVYVVDLLLQIKRKLK
jgi:hypothetical protein